jgi:hypothetical protein
VSATNSHNSEVTAMTTSGTKMRAMIHMEGLLELGGLNVLSLSRS